MRDHTGLVRNAGDSGGTAAAGDAIRFWGYCCARGQRAHPWNTCRSSGLGFPGAVHPESDAAECYPLGRFDRCPLSPVVSGVNDFSALAFPRGCLWPADDWSGDGLSTGCCHRCDRDCPRYVFPRQVATAAVAAAVDSLSIREPALIGAPILIIEKIDPRVRVVCALAASVGISLQQHLQPLFASAIAGLLLAFLVGLPLKRLIRRLLQINLLMLLVLLTVPFSLAGNVIFEIGPFQVSREGVHQATRIALTGNALMIFMLVLVASIPPVRLAFALQQLSVPPKLVRLFLLSYRYIDVLEQTRGRLSRGMRARGYVPRFTLHSMRTTGYLVGRLLVESIDRAQRVDRAMRLRGFSSGLPMLFTTRLAPADFVFAVFFAMALLGGGQL